MSLNCVFFRQCANKLLDGITTIFGQQNWSVDTQCAESQWWRDIHVSSCECCWAKIHDWQFNSLQSVVIFLYPIFNRYCYFNEERLNVGSSAVDEPRLSNNTCGFHSAINKTLNFLTPTLNKRPLYGQEQRARMSWSFSYKLVINYVQWRELQRLNYRL